MTLEWTNYKSCDIGMDSCEKSCCVCGYHIYERIWNAAIGEELLCERELDNERDRHAVTVIKDGIVIGHVPPKISRICSLFFAEVAA